MVLRELQPVFQDPEIVLNPWLAEVEARWQDIPEFEAGSENLEHLAIICDGNRRAVRERGFNPFFWTPGVVSPKTQSLIRKIERIGGKAKISGAGGKKENSGIILAYHQAPDALYDLTQRERLPLFEIKLGEEGVRVEKETW